MTEHLLVTTEWLHEHLNDAHLRVVDIRGHVLPATDPPPHYFNHFEDYKTSHIPGAVFVDWVNEITDPYSPNGTQIAQPEAFAALMGLLGIGDETLVVAYDDASGMFAARLWWALNYYGHTQVVVLDGGWEKWTAENRPVTVEIPDVPPAVFTPRPDARLRRTIDQVQAALDGETVLVDVRSPGEFAGEASRAKRGGHIPGAVNLPRGTLLNGDGLLHAPDVLREKFAAAGITLETPEVVVYCNGGVSASYGMLALRAAGFENVAVYDGSWKEWGNDDSRPIATP